MNIALIASAGKSERMGSKGNKQFLLLGGKPILSHTLRIFEDCPLVDEIVVLLNVEEIENCWKEIIKKFHFQKVSSVIPGGEERQDSIWNGLQALPASAARVIVHDGARPLVSMEVLNQAIRALEGWAGVVVGVPAKDTIKRADSTGEVKETLDRPELWLVQTPQVFLPEPLFQAHKKAKAEGFYGTDDAVLLERAGYRVKMIMGSYENIKITTPEDLIIAEAILRRK